MSGTAQYQRLNQQESGTELVQPVNDEQKPDQPAYPPPAYSQPTAQTGQATVVAPQHPPTQQTVTYPAPYVQQPVPAPVRYASPVPPQFVGGATPVQQVQYVIQPNVMPQINPIPRPSYGSPHTFLALTIVVLIICAILNLTSLMFGIPALVMALLAHENLSRGDYPSASSKGTIAFVLTLINGAYTFLWGIIVVGLLGGFYCARDYYDYYYYHPLC